MSIHSVSVGGDGGDNCPQDVTEGHAIESEDPKPRTLKEYFRRRDALSQHQLADLVGCTQPSISLYKEGMRRCSGPVAKKISKLTGVPVAVLVDPRRRSKKKKKGAPDPAAVAGLLTAAARLTDADTDDTHDADDRDDADDQ